MRRRPTMVMTATLSVATGLTLTAAGMLGMLEQPLRDVPVLAWLVDDRPSTSTGAGAAVAVAPDPALRPDLGRAPGPAPVVSTAAPVALTLPTLDVDAPLVPVGVLPDGAMEIPDDVGTVGWYATQARRVSPGDPGTAVLAGHRDSRVQGDGALRHLGDLAPGDTVQVVHLDGTLSTWTVDEVLQTPRDALPGDVLFRTDGPPTLALVSCGGEFDVTARSYTDNLIVLASPADAAQARSR